MSKSREIPTISTGEPSTLRTYRKMAAIFFGEDSAATAFLDEKIAESPNGADEEVVQHETQVLYLLANLSSSETEATDDE